MNSEVILHQHWDNLIFTIDAPDAKRWSLRGHRKSEKTKAWFQMIILSSDCESKNEATEKAKKFTVQDVVTEKFMCV